MVGDGEGKQAKRKKKKKKRQHSAGRWKMIEQWEVRATRQELAWPGLAMRWW